MVNPGGHGGSLCASRTGQADWTSRQKGAIDRKDRRLHALRQPFCAESDAKRLNGSWDREPDGRTIGGDSGIVAGSGVESVESARCLRWPLTRGDSGSRCAGTDRWDLAHVLNFWRSLSWVLPAGRGVVMSPFPPGRQLKIAQVDADHRVTVVQRHHRGHARAEVAALRTPTPSSVARK